MLTMSAGATSYGSSPDRNIEDHHGDHSQAAAHSSHCNSSPHSKDGVGVGVKMTAKDVCRGDGVDSDKTLRSTAADHGSSTKSFIILGLIFLLALVVLAGVYTSFPKLDQDEYQYIKVPRSLEDAKDLARVLDRYKDKYFYQVLLAFFVTYIFLQTFAIPGSIFLSIISGFLYPFVLALPLVCLCSGIGASLCYVLSFMISHRLVMIYLPERVATWQQQVDHHRDHLLNYILFLRITPFLPNWFINIVSPVINVPLWPFFLGTVLGVGPPSFVMIQAGTTLHKLTSYGEPFTWSYFLLLALFALLSLLPVLFKERLRKKLE